MLRRSPRLQASSLFHRMFGVGAGAGNSLPVRKLMVAVLLAAAATCLGIFAVAQAQAANGAMTGVTLTSGSPGTLTVSWNTPSPAPTDYRLRWAPVGSDHLSWKNTNETDRGNAYPAAAATSLTLSGLSEGTEFKVQARARYHKGEHKSSPWSGPWVEVQARVMSQPSKASSAAGTRNSETPNSKTRSSSAPATPNLMGAAVTPEGHVMLVWLNPADDSITSYQVLRGPDADSLAVIEDDTGSNGTSYTDETPPAGQTHTYAVKARNASGLSPQSDTATATVPAAEEEEELVTAQQNSDAVLVSNLGQTDDGTAVLNSTYKGAQSFVAGPGLAGFGYHFQGVRVSARPTRFLTNVFVPVAHVSLHSDDSGLPGSRLHTLTLPDGFASTAGFSDYTLSAPPGTVLRGGARYWVVFEVTAQILVLSTTSSTEEDQTPPPVGGWLIDDGRYAYNTDIDEGDPVWEIAAQVIKLAVLGSSDWVTDEPAGEDFPGADFNAHETTGWVTVGTASSGDMTAGVDRNSGQTGDYWYLNTQPGHSYRVEVTFGASTGISTGGSAGIEFLDPDGVDYASSCCESDHNREDSATFVHFTHSHQSREWNRSYMVKVAAFDLYNEGTAVYNGPYLITLTDITGVQQMVHSFSGGTTHPATDLLESGDGDTADIAVSFRTGSHSDGYTLDRIKVLFDHIPAGDANQIVALHPDASGSPGNTEECYLRTDRIAESTVAWTYTPPHTFLATFCASVTLTANTTYWIVFPMTNRNDEVVALATSPDVKNYGSGWSVVGSGKKTTASWVVQADARGRIGLWAKEN